MSKDIAQQMKTTKSDYFRVAYESRNGDRNNYFTMRHPSVNHAIAHAHKLRHDPRFNYCGAFFIQHVIKSESIENCQISIGDAELLGML